MCGGNLSKAMKLETKKTGKIRFLLLLKTSIPINKNLL